MKRITILAYLFFFAYELSAQTPNNYQQYSFPQTQRLDSIIYNTGNKFHSSIKPVFSDHPVFHALGDTVQLDPDTIRKSWLHRKLFHEHLIEINKPEYSVYADFLPDFLVGKDSQSGTTWLNTRGFQLGGSIGKKFSFYTSGYENQAKLAGYLTDFVNEHQIVPGQGIESHVLTQTTAAAKFDDWAYSSAVLSFTPSKYINLTLGQDKHFIGDGYRSMLLSDLSSNYPFFKATFELGNVRFMSFWAQMQDIRAPILSYENGFRKKWGVFHYADWNVNERLSIGFFESIIWQDADSTGKRGFDFAYINPLVFLRPVEKQLGSPDNSMLGLNLKYELSNNIVAYGQFVLDEFRASDFFSNTGDWRNKWGMQLGVRGYDPFAIKGLHYLAEFNTARPYTYSHRAPIINYGHYNQPLAHPMGANFREFVTIWQYSYKRWNLLGQINSARYGLDEGGKNYGKDIYRSYDEQRIGDTGNHITQGIKTDFLYIDGRISYLLNPKTNLRFELGGVIRREKNTFASNQTNWLTFGLRSSLRNLYQDF
ncbi:MAG TPA: hypothetical protein VNI52_05985 [Sphingobacteriaceae bacterium]|nr:hypothetical protein [Sphingobacteriaceae bacterium]